MFPTFSSLDFIDASAVDLVTVGKERSLFVRTTNSEHVALSELRATVTFSFVEKASPLNHHVAHIIEMRTGAKMMGVAAARVIARVHYDRRHETAHQCEHDAVREPPL